MMLELHNVSIGRLISSLSLTVEDGRLVCLTGAEGAGKTTLLRAVMGFLPIDEGHISIDGELLTPKSAPYFRRQMAYVPQLLTVPDDYPLDTRYVSLLTHAVESHKPLLIVDEPPQQLSQEDAMLVDGLLTEASQKGTTILAVNGRVQSKRVTL